MRRVGWLLRTDGTGASDGREAGRAIEQDAHARGIRVESTRGEAPYAFGMENAEHPIVDGGVERFHAFFDDSADANRFAHFLEPLDGVGLVSVQGPPQPPVVFGGSRSAKSIGAQLVGKSLGAATPDFEPQQGHLSPAPDGVDARAAWSLPGGRGAGVRIIDVEGGWNLRHEDLVQKLFAGLPTVHDDDHGTSVCGVVGADDNGFGVVGVAPDAVFGGVSYWLDEQGQRWDVAAALRRATRSLRAGDVLLIEVHLPGPHHPDDGSQDGYLPVEYWEESFDAIRRAVDRGIYVVEAAGNGGEDLDHQDYRGRLSRGARDSGAILVGGGASLWSGTPHARMSWSNYGSRVDVQGWGEDVVTTGGTQREDYCNLWNPGVASRCYTRTFGGTSSQNISS